VAGSPRRSLWIAGAALLIAVLAAAGVLAVGNSRHNGVTPGPAAAGGSASQGEVIFQTGRDASGAPIPRSSSGQGGGMMGGGGMMMGGGCATCHGSDGRGRSTMMFTAPNITYGNLTAPQGMLQPDGTRGPTYTDATLRTAVTQGIDPEGSHLEWPMPQWQLSGPQWSDLLAYLKTLR
jgi:hypothetical protein